MKKKTSWTRLLLISGISAISAFYCSPISPDQAGNSTQTGNGMVAGILYEPDGTTPARGAKVYLRKKNTLADTTGALLKRLATTTDTVITDDSGKFVIDSVDTGTYVIEGSDGSNNLAINDSVPVVDPDSTVTLPPDTLKPAGAIRGVIRLSEGGDPRKVFILAFGIDRFARVEASGLFKFNGLAEGKYDLRLISSLDNYGVLDTVNIPVISADTTDMDTIDLPFTGIPTPKNVAIAYDTLKQIVTLSWSKADPTLVNGYYVYRRNVDSNTVLARINTSPITDTLYRDSTGIQDQTYEYRVAAVDKNATEGTKSAGVSVKVVGAFTYLKDFGTAGNSVGQFSLPGDIAIDKNNNFWVADQNRSKIMKFNNSGNFIAEWGIAGTNSGELNNPFGIDIDSQGNILISEWQGKKVQKFDTLGNLLFEIDTNGVQIFDVSTDENGSVYFSMGVNSDYSKHIMKFSSNGTFIKSWIINSSNLNFALKVLKGKVYCATSNEQAGQQYADNMIEVFDTSGTPIKQIHIRQPNETSVISIRDIDFDENDNMYISDPETGSIRIYDKDLNFVTKFGRKGNGTGDFSWIQGVAIFTNGIAVTDRVQIHLFQR